MFSVNIRKLVKGGPGKEGYLAGSRREKERKTKKKRKKMDKKKGMMVDISLAKLAVVEHLVTSSIIPRVKPCS